jgi:hypothetical protein
VAECAQALDSGAGPTTDGGLEEAFEHIGCLGHAAEIVVREVGQTRGEPGVAPRLRSRPYPARMCRNITELRGLEPPATREEIEAAARQFVRKITGVARPNLTLAASLETAALEIADISEQLLRAVPARRQPPKTVPPLRRPEVRERLGLAPFPG